MRDVLAGITTAHGSVTAYVTRHGLDARELASLRARLLA